MMHLDAVARNEGAREPTQRTVTADRPTRSARDEAPTGWITTQVEASVAATARAAMTWMTEHSGTVQPTRHRKMPVERESPDDVAPLVQAPRVRAGSPPTSRPLRDAPVQRPSIPPRLTHSRRGNTQGSRGNEERSGARGDTVNGGARGKAVNRTTRGSRASAFGEDASAPRPEGRPAAGRLTGPTAFSGANWRWRAAAARRAAGSARAARAALAPRQRQKAAAAAAAASRRPASGPRARAPQAGATG
jgi:hypothetical protein